MGDYNKTRVLTKLNSALRCRPGVYGILLELILVMNHCWDCSMALTLGFCLHTMGYRAPITMVKQCEAHPLWAGTSLYLMFLLTCMILYILDRSVGLVGKLCASIRGNFVRKLPSYGRFISIIMSTTSSCQSHHHQVVGKCERSGMREFTAEKSLGRKTLCFLG